MTNTNITRSFGIALVGAVLAFAACDSGDSKDAKDSKVAKKDAKSAVAKTDAKADAKVDAKEDAKEDAPDGPTAAVDQPPPKDDVDVVKVASIAKEIEADPAKADEILAKNGMDRSKFETTIASIAKDELKSDMYIQALTAESKGTG